MHSRYRHLLNGRCFYLTRDVSEIDFDQAFLNPDTNHEVSRYPFTVLVNAGDSFTIETHGICTLAIAIDHVAAVSTAVKHLETTFIALTISE